MKTLFNLATVLFLLLPQDYRQTSFGPRFAINDGAIQCDNVTVNEAYVWNNEATTPTIIGLTPAEYYETIIDTLGGSGTQCFNVQPAGCFLAIAAAVSHVSCNGKATGKISLSVTTATPPVSYQWSNGAHGAAINHLVAGKYSVTVADAFGCVKKRVFNIFEPSTITISLDSVATADETGSGLIWVTVSGGKPGYSYQWIDPVGRIHDSEDLIGLMFSGFYFLKVTDMTGCVARLDSVFVDLNVSAESLPNFKTVKVYPVPACEELFIDIEGPIEIIVIAGADGRICKRLSNPDSHRVNVSDLASGWYFIRAYDGYVWHIARVVK